ncbi:hypothetical protein [Rhodoferax sp.]|uniref:hypothetical protein n=1 Tax=Rhodoferax sp. TaxID=50421 RepID=UPI0025F587FC|nr:hypothetical protein [Rhodoferax sp.]
MQITQHLKPILAIAVFILAPHALAQQTLVVLRTTWSALTPEQRMKIQETKIVDLREPGAYGLVIDNQAVDESTRGTNGGAALGGALGNASYIDHAFKPNNNYSAKTQLAAGLLGALAGSMLDTSAVSRHHIRYAIKRQDGEIEYRDAVQQDAFRHPVGICLELATMHPAPQSLCGQTAAAFSQLQLKTDAGENKIFAPVKQNDAIPSISPSEQVQCKLGNLAPVITSIEKCTSISGKIF